MASAFLSHIEKLESIERMIVTAELRRDRIVNEIEKHRDAPTWCVRELDSDVIAV